MMEWILIVQLFSFRGLPVIDMHSEEACIAAAKNLILSEVYEPRGFAWCINRKTGQIIPVSIVRLKPR